jgi:hypothetical protein
LLLLGLAVGSDDGEYVLLGDDQVLDVVDLEFVTGVLGVSLAVSGSTIPLFVFSSFSTGLTTTRSPNGLRFMCNPPQLKLMFLALPRPERLALAWVDC